jgi:hypothetical protein
MTAAVLSPSAAEMAALVTEREMLRLLGLPRGRALEGDLLDRARGAREWYTHHGDPFVASRRVAIPAAGSREGSLVDRVLVEDGTELRSAVLAQRLEAGTAHALVALAASAGRAVAAEVKRLWAAERPDEAYFLDRFAVGVTERLVFWASGELCRGSERSGETLLAHLSPGCGHWDLRDQHRVMAILTGEKNPPGAEETARLGPIGLLSSGALDPQHSVLAVLGVTRRKGTTTPEDLCRACDLDPCAFRRAPFAAVAAAALELP